MSASRDWIDETVVTVLLDFLDTSLLVGRIPGRECYVMVDHRNGDRREDRSIGKRLQARRTERSCDRDADAAAQFRVFTLGPADAPTHSRNALKELEASRVVRVRANLPIRRRDRQMSAYLKARNEQVCAAIGCALFPLK